MVEWLRLFILSRWILTYEKFGLDGKSERIGSVAIIRAIYDFDSYQFSFCINKTSFLIREDYFNHDSLTAQMRFFLANRLTVMVSPFGGYGACPLL
jgi:hypothetical protein